METILSLRTQREHICAGCGLDATCMAEDGFAATAVATAGCSNRCLNTAQYMRGSACPAASCIRHTLEEPGRSDSCRAETEGPQQLVDGGAPACTQRQLCVHNVVVNACNRAAMTIPVGTRCWPVGYWDAGQRLQQCTSLSWGLGNITFQNSDVTPKCCLTQMTITAQPSVLQAAATTCHTSGGRQKSCNDTARKCSLLEAATPTTVTPVSRSKAHQASKTLTVEHNLLALKQVHAPLFKTRCTAHASCSCIRHLCNM